MEEKHKVQLINIIIIIIDLLLLGVICGNHCRVPDQPKVLIKNEIKTEADAVEVAICGINSMCLWRCPKDILNGCEMDKISEQKADTMN
jgi:hypothetical protein